MRTIPGPATVPTVTRHPIRVMGRVIINAIRRQTDEREVDQRQEHHRHGHDEHVHRVQHRRFRRRGDRPNRGKESRNPAVWVEGQS